MEKPTSKGTGVFRNTIAILITLSMGAALSAQTRLAIKSYTGVVELTVSQPAYKVVVLQYASDPKAHDSQWYGFHTIEASVSDRTVTHGMPLVGERVFFRAYEYQPTPAPAPQQQTPPAAAEERKAGNEP